MPMRMGPMEIIIVMVIFTLVFGVGKLPQMGSSMGSAIKNFREGLAGLADDETEEPPAAVKDEKETD